MVFAAPVGDYRVRLKECLRILGVLEAAHVRRPLLPLDDTERAFLTGVLTEVGLRPVAPGPVLVGPETVARETVSAGIVGDDREPLLSAVTRAATNPGIFTCSPTSVVVGRSHRWPSNLRTS